MGVKIRMKRQPDAPKRNTQERSSQARKEKRDSVKSGSRNTQAESTAKKGTGEHNIQPNAKHSVLGISLNPETARQAIILSEIIGPPLAKRRR